MPFANEHSARQLPPLKFVTFRRSRLNFPKGISAILGIEGRGKSKRTRIQALRFDKSVWTPSAAAKWLRDKGFKDRIEPAKAGPITTKRKPDRRRKSAQLVGKKPAVKKRASTKKSRSDGRSVNPFLAAFAERMKLMPHQRKAGTHLEAVAMPAPKHVLIGLGPRDTRLIKQLTRALRAKNRMKRRDSALRRQIAAILESPSRRK